MNIDIVFCSEYFVIFEIQSSFYKLQLYKLEQNYTNLKLKFVQVCTTMFLGSLYPKNRIIALVVFNSQNQITE